MYYTIYVRVCTVFVILYSTGYTYTYWVMSILTVYTCTCNVHTVQKVVRTYYLCTEYFVSRKKEISRANTFIDEYVIVYTVHAHTVLVLKFLMMSLMFTKRDNSNLLHSTVVYRKHICFKAAYKLVFLYKYDLVRKEYCTHKSTIQVSTNENSSMRQRNLSPSRALEWSGEFRRTPVCQ